MTASQENGIDLTRDSNARVASRVRKALARFAPWLDRAARLVLGGVFAWAAVPKILNPDGFAQDIANYHLLPDSLVGLSAALVPWLELVASATLLFGVFVPGSLLILATLLVMFCGFLMQAIFRDIRIDCGCFGGAAESEIGWWSVARNCGLLLCALVIFLLRRARRNPQGSPEPT